MLQVARVLKNVFQVFLDIVPSDILAAGIIVLVRVEQANNRRREEVYERYQIPLHDIPQVKQVIIESADEKTEEK